MAVKKLYSQIPNGAICVVIFPDRGERYLDTIYADDWVEEHFGNEEVLLSAAAAPKEEYVVTVA